MLKSRIVAIALIGIILSSSSISVVDGYTISINVKEINEKLPPSENPIPQSFKTNIFDGVNMRLFNFDDDAVSRIPYKIFLLDGIAAILQYDPQDDLNKNVDEDINYQTISIQLRDGVGAQTNDYDANNDIRIIKIKQDNDRKALWERIFPLERIKNTIKSLYKEIQNDHIISYVQSSEAYTDDDKIEQFSVLDSEFEQIDKFIGKANYVGDQLGIQWQHLTDVDKFIGKTNYVGIQLAGHAKQLTDPEKFVKKSNFVGKQLTISVYRVVDPHQPALLVLLIPLASFVLIRSENENIQFYHIQRFVSIVFILILVSSVIISPYYLATLYWGRAFAQEPEEIGPPTAPPETEIQQQPIEETSVPPPADEIPLETPVEEIHVQETPVQETPVQETPVQETPVQETPVQETPVQETPVQETPVQEPVENKSQIIVQSNNYSDSRDESFILLENVTLDLQHYTPKQNYNHTVLFNETINLISDQITELQSVLLQNKTIQLSEQLTVNDQIILPESHITPPQDLSPKLFTTGFISDYILNRLTGDTVPNSTESWQFENGTSDVTFNDDATIDHTEGINGTSLLLDGTLDFVTTNGTNATTYITDMSIAAWVKPNYTNGSPEFTVVSKGKSFVLSINNIIEPYRIAKFSIFDGIKWTTVESSVTIPDNSWTHLVARFNKTAIQIYVNGTLQNTVSHNGVPYVSEKGQIEIKTLPEITSYYDIVIGASVTPNMASDAYNMFSGLIDGVQLYDHKLLSEDVMEIFQETVPIKAPIIPPEPVSRPEPVLQYRIINSSEIPVIVPVSDLDDTKHLTASAIITPNYTGGSPEFTVLSRENSFILSLNKMVPPERMVKFSVYDGVMWHIVSGSTPINGTTHVAAVVNGSRISIYVNGTLDGKLETGPPEMAASTADVIIGAYQNTLRGDVKQSNLFSGIIDDATIYEYSMVDWEIKEEYEKSLLVNQPYDSQKIAISLQDRIKTNEYAGKPIDSSLPNNSTVSESLRITEDLILNLNGIPIIPVQESLILSDNITLTLNEEQQTQVNSTVLPENLIISDSMYLKLNDTTYTGLDEGLLFSETILLLLNNQTVSFSNSTSRLTHGIIEIGKIVNWTQTVMVNNTEDLSNVLVELPADAQNIEIHKSDENGTAIEIPEEEIVIISPELEPVQNEFDVPRPKDLILDEIAKEHDIQNVVPLDQATLGDLDDIKQKDKPTMALLINETGVDANATGSIIPQNYTQQNQTEYTVKFQTPAPYAIENDYSTETKFQKNVTVTHNSTLHYTDVKSYTDIPEYFVTKNAQFKLYWMINDTKVDVTHDQRVNVTFADTDGNGIVDRMEWIVPQLSEQDFIVEGIIKITKAWHLDSNREIIEDVYPQVKTRDSIWTDPIPSEHYIRVEFEKGLASYNDITIYAKSNSSGIVEVYEANGTEIIASFGSISEDKKYRILLTNLTNIQNTFDLKVIGNPVEFDYIVDPNVVTVTSTPLQSSDDAEQRLDTNAVSLAGGDLEMVWDNGNGYNQLVGIRFPNIQVPRGASITSSNIQFTVDENTNTNPITISIRGQAADNPGTFTAAASDISNRATTTKKVNWSPPSTWTVVGTAGPDQLTPNISTVIQELVNRPGWQKGNSIVIIINGTAGGARVAESWDGTGDPTMSITYDTRSVAFVQPDAGAPGMNLQVQLITESIDSPNVVTTNSSSITVGPTILTDSSGTKVQTDGRVLSTMFFINASAPPQTVRISVDGIPVNQTFKIIDKSKNFVGTGNYIGASGIQTLGNNLGKNGNRTVGGTIVLDSLLVPSTVTLLIDTSDKDPNRNGNQGYLPAIIVVDGPVQINGTISVNGNIGQNAAGDTGGAGGNGGPGGGGGGGGAGADGGVGGDGGDGFTGGGGGSCENDDCGGTNGGDGGDGTGAVGAASSGTGSDNGGIGGIAILGNNTAGGGGSASGSEMGSGGGGTGFFFGSGGTGGTTGASGTSRNGGGGGQGTTDEYDAPGAGFGTVGGAGENGVTGGRVHGSSQLVPLAGGSGGGGGNADNGGGDGGGGGAGGGGAILIYANQPINFSSTGVVAADGGNGGNRGGADGGSGGGGSGGGIILQSKSTTLTATSLTAAGGTASNNAGDGGEGRVRVDGLNSTTANIPSPLTSEFVGPAITKMNGTYITGRAGASLTVNATIKANGVFTSFKVQTSAAGDFAIPVTYSGETNYVTVIQNTTNTSQFVMSSAAAGIFYKKSISDIVGIDDDIIKIGMTMKDTATIDDFISKRVFVNLIDGTRVDSLAIADTIDIDVSLKSLLSTTTINDDITIGMKMQENAAIDDFISKRVFVNLIDGTRVDSLAIADTIDIDVSLKSLLSTTTINDVVEAKLVKTIQDSATIDDVISKRVFVNLIDGTRVDSLTTSDTIFAFTSKKPLLNEVAIDDHITSALVKPLADSATIDDVISKRVFVNLIDGTRVDSLTTSDTIFAFTSKKPLLNEVAIDDHITSALVKPLADSATIDDVISKRVFVKLTDGTRLDSLTTSDTIFAFTSKKPLLNEVAIDDHITVALVKYLEDTARIDDVITKRVFVNLIDGTRVDSLAIADTIDIDVSLKSLQDVTTIDDKIFTNIIKQLEDSISIDDSLKYKASILLHDEIGIDDNISKIKHGLQQEVTNSYLGINDYISAKYFVLIDDEISIDDSVIPGIFYKRLLESSIFIDDTIFALTRKTIQDNLIIDDKITTKAKMSLFDELSVADFLGKILHVNPTDNVGIDDTIFVKVRTVLDDSMTIDDQLSAKAKVLLSDTILIDDVLGKIVHVPLSSTMLIDDTIFVKVRTVLDDSMTIDDQLSAKAKVLLSDTILIDDVLGKIVHVPLSSTMLIDDTIFVKVRTVLDDSMTIDDQLSAKAKVLLSDTILIDDVLGKIVHVPLSSTMLIDDTIFVKVRTVLDDSMTIDDQLSAKAKVLLSDTILIDDVLGKIVHVPLSSTMLIDDTIFVKVRTVLDDSMTIDDQLSAKAKVLLSDTILIDDVLGKIVHVPLSSTMLIDDTIFVKVRTVLDDSMTIDDQLSAKAKVLLSDTILIDDVLGKIVHVPLSSTMLIDDTIFVKVRTVLDDSMTIDDQLSAKAKVLLSDTILIDDVLGKIVHVPLSSTMLIDDTIFALTRKTIQDNLIIDDKITTKAKMSLFDELSVADFLGKILHVNPTDNVGIDDTIFALTRKTIQDNLIIDDKITTKAKMSLFDELSVADFLGKILHVNPTDNVGIDDTIFALTRKTIQDNLIIDDKITTKAKMSLFDELSVADFLGKILHVNPTDNVGIDDTIFALTRKTIQDNLIIDDKITTKAKMSLFDELSVADFLGKILHVNPTDNVGIDDTIFALTRKTIQDNLIIDDKITTKAKMSLFDELSVADFLGKILHVNPTDNVGIDDTIFALTRKTIQDNLIIDDKITTKAKMSLFDELSVADFLGKILHVNPTDNVGIDDTIFALTRKTIQDNLIIDDKITTKAKMSLFDELVTTDLIFTKSFRFVSDSLTTDDKIYTKAMYRLFDTVTIDDAISKVTHIQSLQDSVAITDLIFTKSFRFVSDSLTTDDKIYTKAMYRLFDTVTIDDAISKVTHIQSLQDSVAITDLIFTKSFRFVSDSLTTDDKIYTKAMYRLFDTVTIDDAISKVTHIQSLQDSVAITDLIFTKSFRFVSDSLTTDDKIYTKAMYRLFEGITTEDLLSAKAKMSLSDEASIDDKIFAKLRRIISDIVTVDDSISKKAMYRMFEGITTEDLLSAKAKMSLSDEASIDDKIFAKLRRIISDIVTVDDSISKKAMYRMFEGITTEDLLSAKAKMSLSDEASIDDKIFAKLRRIILDGITLDDPILVKGALNIETRDSDYSLVPLALYRIIPDPDTGTGWKDVTDGGPEDYDGLPNGQINVFAPLGTYRINQTAIPAGLSSLVNFTYATVHPLDMNATALFRVFDQTTDNPQDLANTDSDILDIADNGFDNLLLGIQLVKVTNGTQVIVSKTSDMPAPIFAGVNNATAISNATALQYTLLYKNMILPPNASPENIIDAFRQTPYDSGNFTQTTFVGVMAATEPASVQYMATQPFDKFNCGQQYLYGIDDTLVPTFGGMTGFNLVLDAAGACPDVQDYLTFEVAQVPPAGSGIPVLGGQDTLLYINPQYPRTSTTAAGVDFSNSVNIDSFTFTLISPLPETGSIDDLTVYLYNAGWSTSGVTVLSKQLLSTGPNTGKVEIIISVDYLSKIVVGGKQIPPPPPPPPFGFGPVLTGPSGVAGGAAPDMPTAKIQRVEYDVCNENIARILAAHDSSSPPRIQLLTTKSGVVDATLSSNQPFAEQNQFTLIDKYLFEAPLAQGESVFTIFAVDRQSNVQRTLVQIEGCQGVLVFVDDQIVLPHIFDVKYQTNSTYIRPTEYSYITQGQGMTVSAIVESPIVPLGKAELYISTLGTAEKTVLPMDINPLLLPDLENVSVISGTIPANLLKGPAVEYWIRVVTAEGVVQESVHSIVGVKPDGYSGESSAEMDTITIKAQGTALKPTAYLTNNGDIPVYGEVSLVADGKKVYSIPVLLTPGQNIINLEWKIPKTDSSTSYMIQTQLDVYDKSYITGMATLDTFVRTKIVPMSDQSEIVPATDELGHIIARPAMMYSSNDGTGQFRVTAPDGTCVIGAGCIVEKSTLKHRGGIDSVIVDGHIYRVRYSGENSPLERFSITSLDSVLGDWNVQIKDSSEFIAAATDDIPVKVQYRAEHSPMVTVRSE